MMHRKATTDIQERSLLFEMEVLRARLEIRDFFLKTTVKEIYENVGQVLSLVRMQLAVLNPDVNELPVEELTSSGHLVGQSIRDLRKMSKSFYPDNDITGTGGLEQAVKHILCIYASKCKTRFEAGVEDWLEAGAKLVVFKMMLHVLTSTFDNGNEVHRITLYSQNGQILLSIIAGNEQSKIAGDEKSMILSPALTSSLQLTDINLHCRHTTSGNTRILFTIPPKNMLV